MQNRSIEVTGKTDAQGHLLMYMGELNDFFRKRPNCRVVAKFYVVPQNTSEALKAYYYKCIVPTMQKAFYDAGERMTEEQTEIKLRQLSPIMQEQEATEDGRYHTTLREIAEVDNSELIEHIETIRQIAAEEFFVCIENPKKI